VFPRKDTQQISVDDMPSYRQAKQIAWVKLKQILKDLRWVKRINEAELTITLKNGSRICLRGADNKDSLRGVGIDFLVLDECADIEESAWTEVLRPTLSDTKGNALFCGTPKGMNWFYDLYQEVKMTTEGRMEFLSIHHIRRWICRCQ
jgi:phage terminase large subunit